MQTKRVGKTLQLQRIGHQRLAFFLVPVLIKVQQGGMIDGVELQDKNQYNSHIIERSVKGEVAPALAFDPHQVAGAYLPLIF